LNARETWVERETTLDEAYAWFREDVAACFAFLEDEYGFRRTSTRDEGRDGFFIRFRSETTAVEVSYEPADDAVEVFLIKVERGRVPSYAQAWRRNWVPLFRYLDHAGAWGAEGPNSVVWGDREGLRRVLAQHAEALRNQGQGRPVGRLLGLRRGEGAGVERGAALRGRRVLRSIGRRRRAARGSDLPGPARCLGYSPTAAREQISQPDHGRGEH
jgi:hypothetical protein